MINRRFLDSQNEGPGRTKQELKSETPTQDSEDNKLAPHCNFRSNPTQRGYRKGLIEIWKQCIRYKTTNQRFGDRARTIIKKGWFSDLEILEIHQQMNRKSCQQDTNTIIETLNIEKQEPSNQIKTPSNRNRNTTPSINSKLVQTQEEKNECSNYKENYLTRRLHYHLSGTRTGKQPKQTLNN